MSNKNRILLE